MWYQGVGTLSLFSEVSFRSGTNEIFFQDLKQVVSVAGLYATGEWPSKKRWNHNWVMKKPWLFKVWVADDYTTQFVLGLEETIMRMGP